MVFTSHNLQRLEVLEHLDRPGSARLAPWLHEAHEGTLAFIKQGPYVRQAAAPDDAVDGEKPHLLQHLLVRQMLLPWLRRARAANGGPKGEHHERMHPAFGCHREVIEHLRGVDQPRTSDAEPK